MGTPNDRPACQAFPSAGLGLNSKSGANSDTALYFREKRYIVEMSSECIAALEGVRLAKVVSCPLQKPCDFSVSRDMCCRLDYSRCAPQCRN
jgi:hypothetical protein